MTTSNQGSALKRHALAAPFVAGLVALTASTLAIAQGAPPAPPAPRTPGAAVAAPAPAPSLPGAGPLLGVWYDDTGKGAVEVAPCGKSLCGRIVWLKDPLNASGQPLTDGYNPEPQMRTRPICGLQILGDLKYQGDGTFDAGWVYDPKEGKQYDAALAPVSASNLKLTGYKGVKLFSKSFTWTRAPVDLPRCDARPKAAAPPAAAPAPAPVRSVPPPRP